MKPPVCVAVTWKRINNMAATMLNHSDLYKELLHNVQVSPQASCML